MAQFKKMLSKQEAAEFLGRGYSRATLDRLRERGQGPKYHQSESGRITYDLEELKRYQRSREHSPEENLTRSTG